MQKLEAPIEITSARAVSDIFAEEYVKNTTEYDNFIKYSAKSLIQFKDPKFGALDGSLSQTWKSLNAVQQKRWKQFLWLRPNQIFKNLAMIFEDQIEPNDIKQGLLGDCYFLSALSVLAEKPDQVTQLFNTREYNQQGIFSVWLNKNGEWLNIVVDDYFPCIESKSPAFSRANGEELWVMILEKAYAKMYGSYERIEGGNPAMALRDLTGAPYENKDDCTADELWDYLWNYLQEGFLMTCYTKTTDKTEEENALGILSGHAYAILHLAKVTDKQGKPARLLKVRNPWGKSEWKGAWADNSPDWTPTLKKQLLVEDKDDGIFWIGVDDFRKYYEGVGICKIHPSYVYNSIQVNFQSKSRQIIHLEVLKKSHCYVSVNQVDERFFFDTNKGYKYAYVRILVAQIVQNNDVNYITGDYQQNRNVSVEATLTEGHYLVVIDMQWPVAQKDCSTVVCNTYSQESIKLSTCKEIDSLLLQKIIFKNFALNNSVKLISYKEQHKLDIEKRIGTSCGMLFFYYRNFTQDVNLVEKVTFNELKGYNIQAPFEENSNSILEFTLTPGNELVVIFTQTITDDGMYSYSYKTGTTLPKFKSSDQIDKKAYLKSIDLTNLTLVGAKGLNKVTLEDYQLQQNNDMIQAFTENTLVVSTVIQRIKIPEEVKEDREVVVLTKEQTAETKEYFMDPQQKAAPAQNDQGELYKVEEDIVQVIDGLAAGKSMSVIFFVVYVVYAILACQTSIKKPNFCSLTVICILLASLLTNNLTKSQLKFLMALQMVALLQTFFGFFLTNIQTQYQFINTDLSTMQWFTEKIFFMVELVGFFFQILSFLLMIRMDVKYETYSEELRNTAYTQQINKIMKQYFGVGGAY